MRPKQTNDNLYTVNIDGASRGNPGPSGAGVVIEAPDGKKYEVSRYLGELTNNQAEYEALILALEELQRLGAHRAHFYSDSQLLVKQLNAEYRIRNDSLKPLFGNALTMLSRLESFEVELIKREFNKRADQLANFAIDKEETTGFIRSS
jgi:ribonuclease HI